MTTTMNVLKRFATTWIAGLATLALLIGAAYSAWMWIDHERSMEDLANRGITTTGMVIANTMAAGVNPAKYEMQQPARYFITYRFTDASGAQHENMTNGTGDFYGQLGPGDKVAIRYLPDNPAVSIYQHPGSMLSATPFTLVGAMLFMAVLSGFLAVAGLRKALAQPRSAA